MPLTYNTGLKFVASAYVKSLGAKVTGSTIEKEIEESAYFPSLYSLAQTFSKYRISNNAYQIPVNEFDLYDIETPFVAFVDIRSKNIDDFVLITEMTDQHLTYLHNSNIKQRASKDTFLRRVRPISDSDDITYKGTIFKAELTDRSGDPVYGAKKNAEMVALRKDIAAVAGTILLLIIAGIGTAPVNNLLPFLTIVSIKLIGLVTAILIFTYDNHNSHAFLKNLCSLSAKTSCDAVLNSTAAKIGGISMGDIGLIYFSSTLVGLFVPGIDFTTRLACISVANVLVVPYVFFSLYYQWKIVKNWCPLCLTVQAIFILELLWSISFFWRHPYMPVLNASMLYTILFSAGMPIIIWHFLKPVLTKARNLDLYYAAYTRLQSNPDIFDKLLKVQAMAPAGWEYLGIDVGNPLAEHVLIKVCNPYCGPCREMHAVLHEMLRNINDVRLKIIFITRNMELDKGRPIVRHLLSLATREFQIQEALDDWYSNPPQDYDAFAKKYPTTASLEEQDKKIEAMSRWCDQANIAYTPTVFLDGYSLPENYAIEDLADVFSLINQKSFV